MPNILTAISKAEIDRTVKQLNDKLERVDQTVREKVDRELEDRLAGKPLTTAQVKKKEKLIASIAKQFEEQIRARIDQLESMRQYEL